MSINGSVAAEVRAELARQRLSGRRAAQQLGWTQNYISTRLSGKTPFSLDDLGAIAELLEVPVTSFFAVQSRAHIADNLSCLVGAAKSALAVAA